ncbi:substrate-binding domain-containing protein [Gracilibacillus sp. YIM 98692]|uniref:substrate-binding domain-containing protein n=1 Tax=Gracilibacillus sp. YIM 98692 TaxID=2663532 RepID=UPI0013D1706C|nr:substrate-binding domain-containing protein [Gracilibacillus sp. YIM 98692]
MKKSLYLLLLVLGLTMFVVSACGSSEGASGDSEGADSGEDTSSEESSSEEGTSDEQIDIGFAIKTQDSPYFVSLVEQIEQLGEAEGWNVDVLDANGDTTKESNNISTFISQGKDLIFVDAIEPSAVVSSIDRAAEAGIPVINLDSGVDEEANDVTTVYSDNEQNGRLVGLEYAEKMSDEEIKAIILSGAKGNVAGKERRTGLFTGIIEGKTGISEEEAWEEALAFDDELLSSGQAKHEEANFSVVGQGWGNWTEELGLSEAEDLITANQDLTTVLGENDQMVFGAITALENAGIEGVDMVAAADGAHEAFDLIKEGEYFATGLNSPTLVAEKGVEIAKEILVDGEDPKGYPEVTLTEPAAITEENVDEYYDLGF